MLESGVPLISSLERCCINVLMNKWMNELRLVPESAVKMSWTSGRKKTLYQEMICKRWLIKIDNSVNRTTQINIHNWTRYNFKNSDAHMISGQYSYHCIKIHVTSNDDCHQEYEHFQYNQGNDVNQHWAQCKPLPLMALYHKKATMPKDLPT